MLKKGKVIKDINVVEIDEIAVLSPSKFQLSYVKFTGGFFGSQEQIKIEKYKSRHVL